jgi:hypothetical protein
MLFAMKQLFTCAAFLGCMVGMHADTLYTRDGRTVRGTFISGNSREVRFLPDGGSTQRFPITSVDRISFGDTSGTPASRSREAYGSTRSDRTTAASTGTRNRVAGELIPAGTVVTIRLIDAIDSDTTNAGQTFRASLDDPLIVNGRTVAPQGADATVKVVRVDESGTFAGREQVALVLSDVTVNGRTYPIETNHAELSAKSRKDETVKIVGGTAVVGAIIGAIAGGAKGAAIGAATGAGAGAAVQAIRGQRVQVPSETRLDFTVVDTPALQ